MYNKLYIILFILLFSCVTIITGCAKDKSTTIEGTVIEVEDNRILVSQKDGIKAQELDKNIEKLKADESFELIWINTKEIDQEFNKGDQVKVLVIDNLADSYPPYAAAKEIEVKNNINGDVVDKNQKNLETNYSQNNQNKSKWQEYINSRYKYSIKFPKSWPVGPEAENGDGVVLFPTNSEVDMRVYASNYLKDFSKPYQNATKEGFNQEKIKLNNGIKVDLITGTEDNKIHFEMVHLSNDKEYHFIAKVTEDFFEKQKDTLLEVVKSFELVEDNIKSTKPQEFDFNQEIAAKYAIVALQEFNTNTNKKGKLNDYKIELPMFSSLIVKTDAGNKKKIVIVIFPHKDEENYYGVVRLLLNKDNYFEIKFRGYHAKDSIEELISEVKEPALEK